MLGSSIVVFTAHRQTRRQISRALNSGGIQTRFVENATEFTAALASATPDLIILDCDNADTTSIEQAIEIVRQHGAHAPVVLLSVGADKAPLLALVQSHDVGNLVAKHGAIRAVYPLLDERELLVTCEKVIRRNIFGIDKYVGSWGVVLHRAVITGVADKTPFLNSFEEYLSDLDCPPSIVPGIVTVAEELILNAVVHAPRDAAGNPKYEEQGLAADLVLEPNEYVDVVYGCDGQRLMLSVSDNFGGMDRSTLYRYLTRGFDDVQMEAETKASGAGLGLSLSFRSIHQLIFNVHETRRTEVIAGWYLRVNTASEFRQVSKSLNIFWLPAESPVRENALPRHGKTPTPHVALSGRIDETTSFDAATQTAVLDLRGVSAITSRGLRRWLEFVAQMHGRSLEIRACPEAMVRLATEVAGMLQGVRVASVLVPIECMACGHEATLERALDDVFRPVEERCPQCRDSLRFAGVTEQYQMFVDYCRAAS